MTPTEARAALDAVARSSPDPTLSAAITELLTLDRINTAHGSSYSVVHRAALGRPALRPAVAALMRAHADCLISVIDEQASELEAMPERWTRKRAPVECRIRVDAANLVALLRAASELD